MYTSGFTLLYRDEEQDWLYEDKVRFTWWLQLRTKATPKPCIQSVGKTRIKVNLNYGEYATTISYLSRLWDADERAVNAFLSLIEEDGRIETRKESGILIIRICNYERFSPPSGYFNRHATTEKQEIMQRETQTETREQMQSPLPIQTQSQMLSETPINKINLKIENLSVGDNVREEEFFKIFRDDEDSQHWVCKGIDVSVQEMLVLLDQFEGFVKGSNEIHPNYGRFKSHFMNWARIQKRENEIKNSKIDQNEKRKEPGSSAAERRRGTEGSARTDADYEQPFPSRNQ